MYIVTDSNMDFEIFHVCKDELKLLELLVTFKERYNCQNIEIERMSFAEFLSQRVVHHN